MRSVRCTVLSPKPCVRPSDGYSRAMRRLKKAVWVTLVNRIAGTNVLSFAIRSRLYGLVGGIRLAPDVKIGGGALFHPGCNVTIAARSYINRQARFYGQASIRIGRDCVVAHNVIFETTDHEPGGSVRRAGRNYYKPIVVGDGCFVGARAMLMRGVTVGEGCVIGAGAVVVRDCEANGLYAGVPARRVKSLPT